MPLRMIRYQTRPENIAENRRLIESVFEELKTQKPADARYMVLSLPDGRFFHIVETEAAESPIGKLPTHLAFQEDVRARCIEPPQASEAIVIGSYRMLEAR